MHEWMKDMKAQADGQDLGEEGPSGRCTLFQVHIQQRYHETSFVLVLVPILGGDVDVLAGSFLAARLPIFEGKFGHPSFGARWWTACCTRTITDS